MTFASSSFVGIEGPLSEGGNWVMTTTFWGDLRKNDGVAVLDPHGIECAKRFVGLTFSANHFCEVVFKFVPAGAQLFLFYCNVRMNATAGLYQVVTAFDVAPNILQLVRWSNTGVSTQIGTNITTPANMVVGDKLRLEAVGSTLTVKLNGAVLRTAVDATFTTGQPGIGGWAADLVSDVEFIGSWSAGDIGPPPIRARTPNHRFSI